MYVKRISTKGEVEHLDWHNNYITLRSNAGIEYPGYMIHEAAMWSQAHREWIFLPRRASKEKYVCWIGIVHMYKIAFKNVVMAFKSFGILEVH